MVSHHFALDAKQLRLCFRVQAEGQLAYRGQCPGLLSGFVELRDISCQGQAEIGVLHDFVINAGLAGVEKCSFARSALQLFQRPSCYSNVNLWLLLSFSPFFLLLMYLVGGCCPFTLMYICMPNICSQYRQLLLIWDGCKGSKAVCWLH